MSVIAQKPPGVDLPEALIHLSRLIRSTTPKIPNIKMKHIPKIIAATGVAFTVPSPGNVTGYPVFSGSVGTGFVCPCVVAVPCGSSSVL